MGEEAIIPPGQAFDFDGLAREFFEASPLPHVAVVGPAHTVRYANSAFTRLAGKSDSEIIGHPFNHAVPTDEAHCCGELLDRVHRTAVAETLIVQAQSGKRSVYWSCLVWPILGPMDCPLGLMVQMNNVTELTAFRQEVTSMNEALLVSAARQHELTESAETFNAQLWDLNRLLEQRTAEVEHKAQELRRLNTMQVQTEQRERKHLAEVLHDGMQQVLVAAKMRLESLRSRVDPEARNAVAQVNELLTRCIQTSRTLAIELFPPALHYGGLTAGLRWLADEIREKHHLAVHLKLDEDAEPQTDESRTLLFQAARELLFNVVKHAEVDRAVMTLEREPPGAEAGGGAATTGGGGLRLEVIDSGKGFDPAAIPVESGAAKPAGAPPLASHAEGVGLRGIRHRVECQGGNMTIASAPGQGARVTLTIPT